MRGNRAETYRRRDRARPGHHLQKPVRLHALAELHQVNGPPVPDGGAVLRFGPPGDPPDPLRLSKPVELAFTTGPPPVMAAPGERGRVQSRSCCAGAAGMRAAASRPGPVLVRAGAGLRAAQCAAPRPW